ncbi:MAG: DNA polymerase III subunit delta [Candidatus Komeilibacteria bacterium]|nr:DNA polymerase III subunit delta [Candidatus Komeilibacteria bacterium]
MHFLIYGAETYSSFHKLLELKNAFLKKNPSGEISTFEDDWKLTDLTTLANQRGLFTNPKLIIIRNSLLKPSVVKPKGRKKTPTTSKASKTTENPTEQLITLLSLDPVNIHFIFYEDSEPDKKFKPSELWQKLSNEKKNVFYFPALTDPLKLSNFVKTYLTTKQIIEPLAITKLLAYCPADLWVVTSELDKLAGFTAGRPITEKDVEALVSPTVPDDIFALVAAIGNKQEKLAIQLLQQQLANELNELALLKLLEREFRFLWHIKAGLEKNKSVLELAKDLSSYDFVIRKKLALAKKISLEQLKNIYLVLLKAESSLKTSTLPPATLLTLLIDTLHKQL